MSVRTYSAMGKAAANVVGYVGQIDQAQYQRLKSQGYQPGDQIGLAGVEAEYESLLRGTPGVQKLQVDSQGNVLTTSSTTRPSPATPCGSAIDGHIQMVAEQALEQGMAAARHTFDKASGRNFTAPAGSAVVEDPNNGQILALATNPTYDPTEFVGGISQANYQALLNNPSDPLLDRTIQGQYAPGLDLQAHHRHRRPAVRADHAQHARSTTPAASPSATSSPTTTTAPPTASSPCRPPSPCRATTSSTPSASTCGTAATPTATTPSRTWPRSTAWARPPGSPCPTRRRARSRPRSPTSRITRPNPKRVHPGRSGIPGNSDQVAIGQDEVLVTPLQLANAYATFANGGNLLVPQLAIDATNPATGHVVQTFPTKVVHTVSLQPAWRAAMLQGFTGVVNNPLGTAYGVFAHTPLAAMDIAGKTGTAQVNAPRQDTSVFTSFAPATNPRFVVDAFVEDAGYGASVAAPVVREIYDGLFGLPLQPVTYSGAGSGGQN